MQPGLRRDRRGGRRLPLITSDSRPWRPGDSARTSCRPASPRSRPPSSRRSCTPRCCTARGSGRPRSRGSPPPCAACTSRRGGRTRRAPCTRPIGDSRDGFGRCTRRRAGCMRRGCGIRCCVGSGPPRSARSARRRSRNRHARGTASSGRNPWLESSRSAHQPACSARRRDSPGAMRSRPAWSPRKRPAPCDTGPRQHTRRSARSRRRRPPRSDPFERCTTRGVCTPGPSRSCPPSRRSARRRACTGPALRRSRGSRSPGWANAAGARTRSPPPPCGAPGRWGRRPG